MPKGIISQTMVVLLDQVIQISDLRGHFAESLIIREAPPANVLEISGPALMLKFLPAVKGVVSIDIVDQVWPDNVGGPNNPTLSTAWQKGYFGPFAYPKNLERAIEHANWRWPGASEVVRRHKAYLRIRCSYTGFCEERHNNVCLPQNPIMELNFMTELTRLILNNHLNALCYFNPNSEVVLSKELFEEKYLFHQNQKEIAISLWTNVRLFNLNPEWCLMDIVGNGQMDKPDHEVVFPKGSFNPNDILAFLYNSTMYVLSEEIQDGDNVPGPGNVRWRAMKCIDSICIPPRETVRWFPSSKEYFPEITLVRERPKPVLKPERLASQSVQTQPAHKPTPEEQGHFKRWEGSTSKYLSEARSLLALPNSSFGLKRLLGLQAEKHPNPKRFPGELVWGIFVRCYWPAYTPGKNRFLGSIVFGFDQHFNEMQNLIPVANTVWQIRNPDTMPPPGSEEFASIIRNDVSEVPRIAVPKILFDGKQAYLQDIVAERSCFPTGYLHCRLVLVLAEKSAAKAQLLPLQYWPKEFQTIWRSEEPAMSQLSISRYLKQYPGEKP